MRSTVLWSKWWQREWRWLAYLTIFSLVFLLLLGLQSSRVFADPDSFYHAKMAVLIRDHGVIRHFPWLDLTVLGQAYTDQHFLYHVALIPFISMLSPLAGIKLATVVFGAILAVVVYWFMRSFRVRWAWAFTLLLFLTQPFVFRISLAKAPSTSLMLLILGLGLMLHYRWRWLVPLAFFYVWWYGGFPLLTIAAITATLVSWAHDRWISRRNTHHWVNNIFAILGRRFRREQPPRHDLRVLLAVVIGTAAGIILNPFFPANLTFYTHQLINIGVINFSKIIGVGGEWYPYGFSNLVGNGSFASLLVLLALFGILFRWRAQSKQTWTLFFLTLFFFFLTLKSRRYVEYYIPFAILFSAFSINDALTGSTGLRLWRETKTMFWQRPAGRWVLGLIMAFILFGVGYIAGRNYQDNYRDLRRGFPASRFQAVSAWLVANTPADSRIVHSDWDEFPLLFYYNDHNRYIVGLDPTFLYKADQDRYWTWVNITLGKFQGDVYQAVTDQLKSQYVFVASGHDVMRRLIEGDDHFIRRYTDAEATVYEAVARP